MDVVLVFDLNGTRIGSLLPKSPDWLPWPSALAVANPKVYVVNMYGKGVTTIDL